MRDRLAAAAACLALGAIAPACALDAADIKPRPGLVITSTVFASIVSGGTGYGYMDTEDHFTLQSVTPDGLGYQIRMSAAGNQKVEDLARRLKWPRHVRHEDLEESSRMTLLYSSNDPENYAGQTFAETSRKVLTALKSGGATPFVFGPYAGLKPDSGPLGALAQTAGGKPPPALPASTGAPLLPDPGQLFGMLFGSARHYYRGTLHRVEPADVPVSVLVNGVRVALPAVHAAGTFSFSPDDTVKAEVWWLDNPDWPLTLRWTMGPASSVVTRIDWDAAGGGAGPDGNARAGAGRDIATQLAGNGCHVELHGIYFNSGSAVLLEESEPMLKQVAEVVKASPAAALTIEGHTDNIGSADYNQKLSQQRAAAVRDALVNRYGIAPGKLTAKGYGLTRPVETNATFEGRARNRRVELARRCTTH